MYHQLQPLRLVGGAEVGTSKSLIRRAVILPVLAAIWLALPIGLKRRIFKLVKVITTYYRVSLNEMCLRLGSLQSLSFLPPRLLLNRKKT
jgi:hypothetical protein